MIEITPIGVMETATNATINVYQKAIQIVHLLVSCQYHICTVVKNGKFSTIIPYDDKRVRLCHCCIPLNFLDFKDLKKLKKANEGRKGQMKGQNI